MLVKVTDFQTNEKGGEIYDCLTEIWYTLQVDMVSCYFKWLLLLEVDLAT